MPDPSTTSAACERVPLERRGLLHGSTHAADHHALLDTMESAFRTDLVIAAVACLALILAAIDLLLELAR